jgi:hypothetical protein
MNYTFALKCSRAVLLPALLMSSSTLPAQIVTLEDGHSTASVRVNSDIAGPAGMFNWSVSGQNQLKQQWFWGRIGPSGPQFSIDTIGTAVSSQAETNMLKTLYDNGSYGVEVNYLLKAGGVGVADINESISVYNHTTDPLNFYLFQYSDFDLGGTGGGDEVWIGEYNAIQQEGMNGIVEGILDPSATAFEANVFGGPGSTLSRLATPGIVLNGVDYAAGNVTWAYEWNLEVAANSKVDIFKDKLVQITVIPEPSTLALVALSLGLWGMARRRQ